MIVALSLWARAGLHVRFKSSTHMLHLKRSIKSTPKNLVQTPSSATPPSQSYPAVFMSSGIFHPGIRQPGSQARAPSPNLYRMTRGSSFFLDPFFVSVDSFFGFGFFLLSRQHAVTNSSEGSTYTGAYSLSAGLSSSSLGASEAAPSGEAVVAFAIALAE